ncbi:hypothetical protein OEG84_25025 [Hoeflea sp. G2-23]|uniref:Uncharacterized protein n=1 Tax=Hoeflea algicola TaxID=2983763 RepID=A0ABT3Z2Z4_9HYPH|nr:hypothetical protein [Hoeflea algicola]MCY0146145.1 hypothetical protein [Hoeflea algicola]MCY0150871.1 hypothetical protein [Hoeflea algicola]
MTTRTVIDPSEDWVMRVSTAGNDVESDGGPYLFDGSLETLQVHQTGIVTDVFQWQRLSTPEVHRCIKLAGAYTGYPMLEISFPTLGYVPHIEWSITSDALGGAVDFPAHHINTVTGSSSTELVSLPVAMIPYTNKFQIIATTANAQGYSLGHGGTPRQGDLYYTVFKRPTT